MFLKGKQVFYQIVSFAALAGLLFFIAENFAEPLSFSLWTVPLFGQRLGWAMIVAALLGGFTMWSYMAGRMAGVNDQAHQAKRARERAEVSADSTSDQVRALQAKVQTLEAALDKAMTSASRQAAPPTVVVETPAETTGDLPA